MAPPRTLGRVLEAMGLTWTPTMGIGTGCLVHLAKADLDDGRLPMGRLVVRVSKHYTAVIDGAIRDTYDPQRAPETICWFDDPARPGVVTRTTTSVGENDIDHAGRYLCPQHIECGRCGGQVVTGR